MKILNEPGPEKNSHPGKISHPEKISLAYIFSKKFESQFVPQTINKFYS